MPVIVLDSADAAIPLADALMDGGLPLIEITFRTPAAAEAIRRLRQERPEILVGAGTVVTAENLHGAQASGARFAIAPGFNPQQVERAKQCGLPFVPGVCTPSETEQALALGCSVLKFSPAEVSGGTAMLNAMASTYAHLGVRFVPTGGVNMSNLAAYLALDIVAAVGGTWLATKKDIAEGKWQQITDRCKEAVEVVAKVRHKAATVGRALRAILKRRDHRSRLCGAPSQPRHGQPAVDHDHRAGRIGKIAAGQRGDGLADVLRQAPAALDRQPFADQLVVLGRHAGGHVGLDDAGPDLVDGDAELAQPRGPELRGHADAGLRDAILAAVDRGDRGRDGRDVDDAAAKGRVGLRC